MNELICSFGGRKYFYCTVWCSVATVLACFKIINSTEWVAILMWFFTNVVVANNREAVAEIKESSVK